LARTSRRENQSEEEFAAFKERARQQAFRITITVADRDGASLFGDTSAILSAPNRPDPVGSIFITNKTSYHRFAGAVPINFFELNLDFSKPPLFDAQRLVSAPTPNASNLTVQGDRDAWIAAISEAVFGVVQKRKTSSNWLHRGFIYDLGVLLLGMPFALYLCWRLHSVIDRIFNGMNEFVVGGAYVFLVLLALNFYRGMFGYAKWAFPTMELTDNRDKAAAHRAVLGAILLGIFINILTTAL